MVQKLKKKSSKTGSKKVATRKNPKKRWWHNIPIIGRTFAGVHIGESLIPVEGGTIVIQSENAPLVGKVHQQLSEILGKKDVSIKYAPKNGRAVSISIILPKGSEDDEDPRMQYLRMAGIG